MMKRTFETLRVLLIGTALAGGPAAAAAQTGIVNANIESRSAAAGLERAVRAVVDRRTPAWIAYRVPLMRPRRATISYADGCCGRCRLEPATELLVLARVEARAIVRLRASAVDCDVDAGGMPVVWLDAVTPDESVAWLTPLANGSAPGDNRQIRDAALSAIALHDASSAARALVSIAREDQRADRRGRALFWLAQRAGTRAIEAISEAIDRDPDTAVKKKAVFALSRLPNDESVPKLIDVARGQKNAAVRKEAMFWLGRSNDPRALKFFEEILLR